MKNSFLLISVLLLSVSVCLAQNSGVLSGRVTERNSTKPIEGATVSIANGEYSTVTNANGDFTFQALPTGSYQVRVSHVGYLFNEQQITVGSTPAKVNVTLEVAYGLGEEVVVAATRVPQNLRKVPAFVQVISQQKLQQYAGSNVLELMSEVAGIEYTRTGVDYITINARGFNSAFNNKVLQMVDGRNSMAALSASLAMFNNGSAMKEDIEKVEVVLGPQSSMYGPNALNAVVNYVTKDPRKYEGTTVSMSAGNQSQFSVRLRDAHVINKRWAYKFVGEYATAKEFTWYDSVRAGGAFQNIPNAFGPAVIIPERNVDFRVSHLRGEAYFYYQIKPGVDIVASGGRAVNDFLQVTTTGRNQMRDIAHSFAQLSFNHPHWFATVNHTWGNLGNWYVINNYTQNFHNRTNSTIKDPNSPLFRNFGFLYPEVADVVTRTPLKQDGKRLNADVRYKYDFPAIGLGISAGLSFQREMPEGYGVTLVDGTKKIRVNQFSGSLQADQRLMGNLRFTGAVRWDSHDVFGDFVSPRFAFVYDLPKGSIHAGWGRAINFPSILSQFSNIAGFLFGNGPGIYYIPNGANVHEPSAIRVTTPLKPEQVSTWELGYKGVVLNNLFVDVNAWFGRSTNFLSAAQNVFGRALSVGDYPVQPRVPGTVDANGILSGALFQTYFNFGDVDAYGIDVAAKYKVGKHVMLSANYSWFDSDIAKDESPVSAFEKNLNAPNHRGYIGLSVTDLGKKQWFASAGVRMVQQYDFFSGNQVGSKKGEGTWAQGKNFDWGPLGGFTTVDLGAGLQPFKHFSINLGITNLFNTPQREFVGTPEIGRLFVAEIKYHIPAKK